MKQLLLFSFILWNAAASAQVSPDIYSYMLNTTGATGYNGIIANVQQVEYSNNFTYVSASGIPDYNIGPWPGNPNTPSNQNYVFKIPRNPVEETGIKTSTPLGHQAVLMNGTVTYNSLDAFSYNNQGIWHQDANVFEAGSFDASGGHSQQFGAYHYHQGPVELFSNIDSSQHSPIIGFSFDGFPIYGPFGYANTSGTGPIRRMQAGYQLRNITQRNSLPDGSNLTPPQWGPAVGTQYPLGSFVEDYEFISGSGDLDEYNGRFCVTPEYPNGIYAYFVTMTTIGNSVYPHMIGPEYYGDVETANIGPGGGHVIITELTTVWDGTVPGGGSCEAVANHFATNLTATSATLNWDAATGAYRYRIRGRVVGGSIWTTLEIQNGAPGFKNVFGLNTNTSYEWQIQAICDANDSVVSAWSQLNTFTLNCIMPTGLNTSPVTTNAASLNWNQTIWGAAGYEIKGRKVGNANWTTLLITAPAANKNVFGLLSGTAYEWTIRTWCTANGSAKSDFATLTTFTTNTSDRIAGFTQVQPDELVMTPNPMIAASKLIVPELPSEDLVRVFNLNGELIKEYEINDEDHLWFSRKDFTAGLYIVRLKTSGSWVKMIVH